MSEAAARAGDPARPPGGPVSGIVLAGGRGSRLGGDKLGRLLRGRPLLDHALLALAPLVAELIVVGPARGALPPLPPELRATVIRARDGQAGLGPLAGAVAGLGLAGQRRSLI
ncbi:MAG: NTP transferase domain-containing protein, partial [Candidatus Limnocylindrales bacterium]